MFVYRLFSSSIAHFVLVIYKLTYDFCYGFTLRWTNCSYLILYYSVTDIHVAGNQGRSIELTFLLMPVNALIIEHLACITFGRFWVWSKTSHANLSNSSVYIAGKFGRQGCHNGQKYAAHSGSTRLVQQIFQSLWQHHVTGQGIPPLKSSVLLK